MIFEYVPRSGWTSSAPGGERISSRLPNSYKHHTAGPMPEGGAKATRRKEEALIRATRAFHINSRGMTDIAYSFAVMPSGRQYELRGPGRSGGHTYGHNSDGYGIVSFGNYEVVRPPETLIAGIRELLDRMHERGWLEGARERHPTKAHRDVGAAGGGTACPGRFLYEQMPELRRPILERHHHHPHGEHGGPGHGHRKGRKHHHGRKRNLTRRGVGGDPGSPHREHPHKHEHRGA